MGKFAEKRPEGLETIFTEKNVRGISTGSTRSTRFFARRAFLFFLEMEVKTEEREKHSNMKGW